jgi:hypothetical protein
MNNQAENLPVNNDGANADTNIVVQGPAVTDLWIGNVQIDLNIPIDPPSPHAPLIIGGTNAGGSAPPSPAAAGSSAADPLIVSSDDDSAPASQRDPAPSASSWTGP